MNKYNFEQRRDFIEWDLDDCGTFEKMGDGALFYYKDIVEKDEELINNNQYEFINNEIFNKYNNLFIKESNKIKTIKRNTKQKINNVVSVF